MPSQPRSSPPWLVWWIWSPAMRIQKISSWPQLSSSSFSSSLRCHLPTPKWIHSTSSVNYSRVALSRINLQSSRLQASLRAKTQSLLYISLNGWRTSSISASTWLNMVTLSPETNWSHSKRTSSSCTIYLVTQKSARVSRPMRCHSSSTRAWKKPTQSRPSASSKILTRRCCLFWQSWFCSWRPDAQVWRQHWPSKSSPTWMFSANSKMKCL